MGKRKPAGDKSPRTLSKKQPRGRKASKHQDSQEVLPSDVDKGKEIAVDIVADDGGEDANLAKNGDDVEVIDGNEEEDVALIESDVQLAGAADVISQCRLLSVDQCPRIPLCRLIPYAKVRGLRKDVTSLKLAFQSECYMPEKGAFIVSMCKSDGEETIVTEDLVSSWSPLWKEIDKEFERELAHKREWKFMSKKMFYVWEGNHRTIAWMEIISELYSEDLDKHIRVVCTMIDPKKVPEISLLACLQRVNTLNVHAVIKPSLRDVLINTNNICEGDASKYINSLSDEERRLIHAGKNKKESTWFPFTRGYLARLVFQVEYSNDLKMTLEGLDKSLPAKELEEAQRKERVKIQKKISDRMGKVLNCLNPKLGDIWKKRLFELQYEGKDSYATLEKLRILANAELRIEKKIVYLKLLESSKLTREAFAMPIRDIDYRGWLSREVFLEKVEIMASNIFEGVVGTLIDPPEIPKDLTMDKYLEGIKLESRRHMFVNLRSRDSKGELKSTRNALDGKGKKSTELEQAAQRIVFRYLKHLHEKDALSEIPLSCKMWTEIENKEVCMYTSFMQKSLSGWELNNCPWWIDFPTGHALQQERELYASHASKVGSFKEPPKEINKKQKERVQTGGKDFVDLGNDDKIDDWAIHDDVEIDKDYEKDVQTLAREIIRYVHIDCVPSQGVLSRKPFYASCVGDYVEMGKAFQHGKKNDAFSRALEFFVGQAGDRVFFRMGKKTKCVVDLIVLDFPTGFKMSGELLDDWNKLTEAHVQYGIMTAAIALGDNGWLVLICPLEGDCLTWIEKYVYVQGMKVERRIVMGNKLPYGSHSHNGCLHMLRNGMLLFVHRMGHSPPLFEKESKSLFDAIGIDVTSDFWTHYMPEVKKTLNPTSSRPVRGAVERSATFMSCILALCCAPHGLVLEMGCGVAPTMQACMARGNICFSFDNDAKVIKEVVEPLILSYSMEHGETSGTKDFGGLASEFAVDPTESPYDSYMLPCYANAKAIGNGKRPHVRQLCSKEEEP